MRKIKKTTADVGMYPPLTKTTRHFTAHFFISDSDHTSHIDPWQRCVQDTASMIECLGYSALSLKKSGTLFAP